MTKTRALTNAAATQDRLNRDEQRATESAAKRDKAVLEAQEAGATYAEIQAATGLSTARVTQVLRRQRQARVTIHVTD